MNAAPVPVLTIFGTETQDLYLVEDAELPAAQAEQRALDFYYYADGYIVPGTSERTTDYFFGGAYLSGWLVQVNH